MYHRIGPADQDPWGLAVSPDHFADHLAVLRQSMRPIALPKLVAALGSGTLPDHAVAVTFDDGYADNLHNARPSLECYDVPATVFVTTGGIGCNHELWWDELERIVLQSDALPETLELAIGGHMYHWPPSRGSDAADGKPLRQHIGVPSGAAPIDRQVLYRQLWGLLRPCSHDEQQRVLSELRRWAKAEAAARPSHRLLGRDELGALADGDIVEIGAHTVTHPALSQLSPASQRNEIRQSKDHIEAWLGRPAVSFAYPYGDFARTSVAAVREAGFRCACTTRSGAVHARTDPFALPRLHVRDWNGDEFAQRLREYQTPLLLEAGRRTATS